MKKIRRGGNVLNFKLKIFNLKFVLCLWLTGEAACPTK